MNELINNPAPAGLIRKLYPAFFIPMATLVFSCNQQPKAEAAFHSPAYSKSDTSKPKFTRDMVDNLKDPSCGMPADCRD